LTNEEFAFLDSYCFLPDVSSSFELSLFVSVLFS
jgi:hypothetical protein